MPDNSQKTALARTLNQFAERKVRGAIDLFGKALPASVVAVVSSGIVTVKFEIAKTTNSPYTLPNVTVPLFGPEYIRYPIQAGCMGVVFPSDAYLGGVSGLGGGVADLSLRGNLSTLVFFPIGNSGWSASDDPNALVLYGPDGVIIRNLAGTSKITTNADGVTVAPPAGKPTAIQSDAQLTGQIKNPGGGTYSQPITTSADVTGNNVIAGAMVSSPAAAFGTAMVGGHDALTTANIGTAAGDLIALDGSAKLPAVDGSQLTNLPSQLTVGSALVVSPYAISTVTVHAHGLGVVPSYVRATMTCLTANAGYSIGDVAMFGVILTGAAIVLDATDLTLITSNAAFTVPNKTTGALTALTPADWSLTLTPYAL